MPDLNVITEWLPLAVLFVVGVWAVIADIRSADRALYNRMQKGGEE